MKNLIRETVIDPTDLGPREVFVLNDIALVVPPTQISIQKEDLIYKWRTLRTKTTTRSPSGQGQVTAHVTILFPENQLLALHRLIVQFKHSPFCYIENRYLRESIVPEWPTHQNMAFTITNLSIRPMPNSSDTWQVELDLLWFNYFPYMFNFLYREEWQTNYIDNFNYNNEVTGSVESYTIGWDINRDTYEKVHNPHMVGSGNVPYMSNTEAKVRGIRNNSLLPLVRRKWSTVDNSYMYDKHKTIYDMQLSHNGAEFDLLPLPDNMQPSMLAREPRVSKIYVRYINLLQRDALLKNFGIDTEVDLLGEGKLWNHVFGEGIDKDPILSESKMIGLHDIVIPSELRKKWIEEMVSHNFSVGFQYHLLQEVNLPQEWQDKVLVKQRQIVKQVLKEANIVLGGIRLAPWLGKEEDITEILDKSEILRNDPRKYDSARKIMGWFLGAGIEPVIAMAAIVNAHVESSLDPKATWGAVPWSRPPINPDQYRDDEVYGQVLAKNRRMNKAKPLDTLHENENYERSSGLFQLNPKDNGLGKNISGKDRHNPSINTARVIAELKTNPVAKARFDRLRQANGTVRDFAKAFCEEIEKPKDPTKAGDERMKKAIAFWGSAAYWRLGDVVLKEEDKASEREKLREQQQNELKELAIEAELSLESAKTPVEQDALNEVSAIFSFLDNQGWEHYSEGTSSNVWQKYIGINVSHSGLDFIKGYSKLPQAYREQGTILTNVSGNISHIVASLPLLSHEFPTQQHLGSVEPSYQFEFAVLDDRQDLEGICYTANFIQGMRASLQSNARRFRPVTDGWCCTVDTFITRLLGSYEEHDTLHDSEENVQSLELKKRIVISRESSGTIEGQPGLSFMQMEMEEINPYEGEALNSTSATRTVIEAAREEILKKLRDPQSFMTEKFKHKFLMLMIAGRAGANLTDPSAEDYGKFKLNIYDPGYIHEIQYAMGSPYENGAFVFNEGTSKSVFVKSIYKDDDIGTILDALEVNHEVRNLGGTLPYKAGYLSPVTAVEQNLRITGTHASLPYDILNKYATNHEQFEAESAVLEAGAIGGGLGGAIGGIVAGIPGATVGVLAGGAIGGGTAAAGAPTYGETYASFDISELLLDDYQIDVIPWKKIITSYSLLDSIMKTGNRMFVEPEAGGFTQDTINSRLYNLEFESHMWQSWQVYLEQFALNTAEWQGPVSLHKNDNYPYLNKQPWNKDIGEKEKDNLRKITEQNFAIAGSPTQSAWNLTEQAFDSIYGVIASAVSSKTQTSDIPQWNHDKANRLLVRRYLENLFPITMHLDMAGADIQRYIEAFRSVDTEGNTPAVVTMRDDLYTNVYSCGNVTSDPGLKETAPFSSILKPGLASKLYGINKFGNPKWITTSESHTGDTNLEISGPVGGVVNFAPQVGYLAKQTGIYNLLVDTNSPSFLPDQGKALTFPGREKLKYLIDITKKGETVGSKFKYPVNTDNENIKVEYLHKILASIADDLIKDSAVLTALDLEHLESVNRTKRIKGSQAYPDLDLPTHPYYGNTFQVYPDFYMWNIYDDAQAFSQETKALIADNVYSVVERCHNSLINIQQGVTWDESRDSVLQEKEIADPVELMTQMQFEGSNEKAANDYSGPSSSPYALVKDAQEHVDDWEKKPQRLISKTFIGSADSVGGLMAREVTSSLPKDYIKGFTVATHESNFNESKQQRLLKGHFAESQYPLRLSPGKYGELNTKFQALTSMFGSKEGYLDQHLDKKNNREIHNEIQDTDLKRPLEYSHVYGKEPLKQLAWDSSKDLMSYKTTLRRAYPTFKLFFVEEDEFESRFLSFDDFYSYNAVKDFTVVQSRKSPADHAVITLQNVGGLLDGTRRDVINDVDYFIDEPGGKTVAEKKLASQGLDPEIGKANNPITQDTDEEQPFGAVILRPGLNVQLRAGFSNDPDNLEVLLSGRIVDVAWNKSGDIAEIMVQSFGTELIQAIKGTDQGGYGPTYFTTHQLLGSMMLEPEVVHFGRWELGQYFQVGEGKDVTLDFEDYSREGFLGKFTFTRKLVNSAVNNPTLYMLLAFGLIGVQLIPGVGKVGRGLRGVLASVPGLGTGLRKLGVMIPKGAKGLTALGETAMSKAAVRGGEAVKLKAARVAIEAELDVGYQLLKTGKTKLHPFRRTLLPETLEAVALQRQSVLAKLNSATSLKAMVKIAESHQNYLYSIFNKGAWMAKPHIENYNGVRGFLSAWGFRPLWKGVGVLAGGAFFELKLLTASALLADLGNFFFRKVHDSTIKEVRKFFARTKASLLLSPQDDNLYPPHPKDYMDISEPSGCNWDTARRRATDALIAGSGLLLWDTEPGETASRWIFPSLVGNKKVNPTSCEYQIASSTIWELFHEMSVRHPGWIYGARPYGTEFRYTMFFGPPAQRYWGRPGSNLFIVRANKLRKYLMQESSEDPLRDMEIREKGFIDLYGKQIADFVVKENEIIDALGTFLSPEGKAQRKMRVAGNQMRAMAMQEYLRTLELRFIPFRRYHMFTSNRDIIWNGLIGSEQAVTNAVDITYYQTMSDTEDNFGSPARTTVVKAHAFIPEHQLRIAPVRYPNCKGYQMALRYGVGELLHRMKDMYRGEILLLGNPRIKPWDIGIIIDTYNDIVGPVEIEQVVHTFSHETGFITEIKPSAVAFANEISGWPILEAMKVFALAVKDIHDRYEGVKGGTDKFNEGTIGLVSDIISKWGPRGSNFFKTKYRRKFGLEGANLESELLGVDSNKLSSADSVIEQLNKERRDTLNTMATSMTAVGAGIAITGGIAAVALKIGRFIPKSKAVAGGAGTLTIGGLTLTGGVATAWAASELSFPGAIWLVGGPILFLHCLRNDSIMLVPLMKNGYPIVSGLSYNDPAMIWNNVAGELQRWVDDTVGGTRDLYSLFNRYHQFAWSKLQSIENIWEIGTTDPTLTGQD